MINIIRKILSAILAFIAALYSAPSGETEKKCNPEFNGTFIQSWMSSTWDNERWEKETSTMKEAGIEYLIIQDVANKSTGKNGQWTVYYESDVPALENAVFPGDAVESALKACSKAGLKVFVGLALFDDFWTQGAITGQYRNMCSIAAEMVKDIYSKYGEKYKDAFYGWYFTPEINNVITCQINISGIAKGLNKIIESINEVSPELPLLLSPFYAEYLSTGPVITLSNLVRFFNKVNFRDGDIFAVQDAVGAKWVKEENLEMTWKMYSAAVESCDADIKLWANCENFSLAFADSAFDGIFTRPATENKGSITETLDRFVWQMDMATKYAENIIVFSYNHYFSPNLVNSAFNNTYLDYLKNNYILEKEAPSKAENFVAKAENGVTLTWEEAEDNIGIAYYRIEKDGKFLSRLEKFYGTEELKYTDENGSLKATYTIEAFDAAGNSSGKITANIK